MKTGTFEEWYQWETRQRESKNVFHFGTYQNFQTDKNGVLKMTYSLLSAKREERAYKCPFIPINWNRETKENCA